MNEWPVCKPQPSLHLCPPRPPVSLPGASARTEPSKGRKGEMQIMQMLKVSLNRIFKEPLLCLSMLLLEAHPILRILYDPF